MTKVSWADATRCSVECKANTARLQRHGVLIARTLLCSRLVRVEQKMKAAKYKEILEDLRERAAT